jgi:hypothetical protein
MVWDESRRGLEMMFRSFNSLLAFCDEVCPGIVAGEYRVVAGVPIQEALERAGPTISMPYLADAAIRRSIRRSGSTGLASSW